MNAEVDAAFNPTVEITAANLDCAGASFGLHTDAAAHLALEESAAVDDVFVAADHDDCLPAPPLNNAVFHQEVGHAGQFNRIVISLDVDVTDL